MTNNQASIKSASLSHRSKQAKTTKGKKVDTAKLVSIKFCLSSCGSVVLVHEEHTGTLNWYISTSDLELFLGKTHALRIIEELTASTKKPRKTTRKGSPTSCLWNERMSQ